MTTPSVAKIREVTQFSRLTFIAKREEIRALAGGPAEEVATKSPQTQAMVAFEQRLQNTDYVKSVLFIKTGALFNIKTVRVLQDQEPGSPFQFEFITIRPVAEVRREVELDVSYMLMQDPEFLAELAKVQKEAQAKEQAARKAAYAAKSKLEHKRREQRARDQKDRAIARKVDEARQRGDLQVTIVNKKAS